MSDRRETLRSGQGEITMSPETRAALRAGRPLKKKHFVEYVDHEAKASGLTGIDDAIRRARDDAPPVSYREMRVRLLLTQLNGK
jgi:hypothetical protein